MLTIVPSRRAANQRIDQLLGAHDRRSDFESRSAWTHDTTTLRELTARAYREHPRPGRLLQPPAPRFLLAEILDRLATGKELHGVEGVAFRDGDEIRKNACENTKGIR